MRFARAQKHARPGLTPGQGLWYYGSPTACDSDDTGEAQLDFEWSGAVAPGTAIWLVTSDAQDPLYDAAYETVSNGVNNGTVVSVISIS
jgi:subtilase family serine protease